MLKFSILNLKFKALDYFFSKRVIIIGNWVIGELEVKNTIIIATNAWFKIRVLRMEI